MRILITVPNSLSQDHLAVLARMNNTVIELENEEIPEGFDVSDFEVIVCNNLLNKYPIEKFKSLKFIQLTSVGTDRIPLDYLKEQGIRVENARGIYSVPIAEWVVLKILEICKYSRHFYAAQQKHKWVKNRNLIELSGQTMALIGYGSIGLEIAKRMQAFDVRIIAIDNHIPEADRMDWIDKFQTSDKINEALAGSDIVVLSLPLSRQTYHLINANRLRLMKEDSILINISRGAIIDEEALVNVLSQNKFKGVALDVFEQEPLEKDSPLWEFENVIITPHNAFVSNKNRERFFDLFMTNLKEFYINDNLFITRTDAIYTEKN